MIKDINDHISYIPSCEIPISGDVGIIRGKKSTYLYDVGSTPECLDFLHSLNGRMQLVISHFHADHTWWLIKHKKGDADVRDDDEISISYERPAFEKLYIGKSTEKYLPDGTIVTEPLLIEDETPSGAPLKLEIIPMPSSHSKGSLALSVDDEYLFLGDSTYCRIRKNAETGEEWAEYNVMKLQQQIAVLKSLKAEKCLISHDRHFIRPKAVVIRQLEAFYSKREPGENIIRVSR